MSPFPPLSATTPPTPCRRPALSEQVGGAVLRTQRRFAQGAAVIPFELQMLEVALDQTISFLEHKSRQIRMLSRAVQDDITQRATTADIRRLLPLQKAVTALEYDARETKLAIRDVRSADAESAGRRGPCVYGQCKRVL